MMPTSIAKDVPSSSRPAPSSPFAAALVTVRWRGDPFSLRRVGDGETATIGSEPGAVAPIPCEALGCEVFPFASVRSGEARVHVPARAVVRVAKANGSASLAAGPTTFALGLGDRVTLRLGAFVIEAVGVEPLPPARRSALVRLASSGASFYVAAIAMVHGLALAAGAYEPPAPDGDDPRASAELVRRYLAAAEGRALASEVVRGDGLGADEGALVNDAPGDGFAGVGARAAEPEGKMGAELSRAAKRRWAAPRRASAPPILARSEAIFDARTFGMLGLFGQGPSAPAASFGDIDVEGLDTTSARGAMWARSIGDAAGADAFGLSGVGLGGGGEARGVGLGDIGSLGHTDGAGGVGTGGAGSRLQGTLGGSSGSWDSGIYSAGYGRLGSARRSRVETDPQSGRIPPEVIQRIVRQNFGRFRLCYERGLARNPALTGRVATHFVLGPDGSVVTASDAGSDLPDASVVQCVNRSFLALAFPAPPGAARVEASYPIVFSPLDGWDR